MDKTVVTMTTLTWEPPENNQICILKKNKYFPFEMAVRVCECWGGGGGG